MKPTTEPQFDPEINQYVAVAMNGQEVFGDNWGDCFKRLQGANEVWATHARRNPDEGEPEDIQARLMVWADELENVSWYDATLARAVAKHMANPTGAELDALAQLRAKYPDVTLLAELQ